VVKPSLNKTQKPDVAVLAPVRYLKSESRILRASEETNSPETVPYESLGGFDPITVVTGIHSKLTVSFGSSNLTS
jgi:hypothetical protein